MVRKFTYRGKSLEELMDMTVDEFAKLLKARARRAVKRASPEYRKLIERVKKVKESGQEKIIKTKVRDAVILPYWVGLKFGVYNGKEYRTVEITPERIGRRLGEFSHTTPPVKHSGPGVGATRGSKFIPLK